MDAAEITALAGGIAVVLRAVTELVKALRARRAVKTGDDRPEPLTV